MMQVSEGSQQVSISKGTLYVVATPIGNLDDMTQRAKNVLQQVDKILAEDTRHAGKLLRHFGIDSEVQACHEHNEQQYSERWLAQLSAGKSIALISDAGTPLISDPGFLLVRACHQQNIPVRTIPGASAVISALSVSGLPSDSFLFAGFLPAKSSARQTRLKELQGESATLIFYESPHRLLAMLGDLVTVFGGQRQACLARELTKMFETVMTTNLQTLAERVEADENQQRGEIVVLVAGVREQSMNEQEGMEVMQVLQDYLPINKASQAAARLTGLNKKQLYKIGLELKEKDKDPS